MSEPDHSTDPEVFRERWESYVQGLNRLAGSVPNERLDELDDAIRTLNDLIDEAADVLAQDEENSESHA